MACAGESLLLAFRRLRSPCGRRSASNQARCFARLAGFGGETASPRAAAAPFLRPRSRGGQDNRLSKAVSSVRSLTNPLFENRSGVVLIEFDHLHELALGTIVAAGEQRFHELVSIGGGLDEDALAGLAGPVRRPQRLRLDGGGAARVRQSR